MFKGEIFYKFHYIRTATVISRESCHFMTLTPAVYSQILSTQNLFFNPLFIPLSGLSKEKGKRDP